MKCPRCDEKMQEVDLDGCRVDLCPNCEGSWYDLDELGTILATPRADLEKSALGPALDEDKLDLVDLEKPLNCPRCGGAMNRYKYLVTSEISLDECPDHGIFLDDGEVTRIFDFLHKWEDGIDPETAARLQLELDRVRMEAQERDQAFLQSLCKSKGKLTGKLLGTIYGFLNRFGL